MNDNEKATSWFSLIIGIFGVFYFDFRVDTFFYALSWIMMIFGGVKLFQQKKDK